MHLPDDRGLHCLHQTRLSAAPASAELRGAYGWNGPTSHLCQKEASRGSSLGFHKNTTIRPVRASEGFRTSGWGLLVD